MIVFENDAFLVLDKPMGWLSIPGRMGKEDPRPCIRTYWEAEKKQKLLPCHRLDCEVSGLLMLAKTEVAHREANGWFEEKIVQKSYEAITEMITPPTGKSFLWKSQLLKGKKRAYVSPVGKLAVTQAEFQNQLKFNGASAGLWKLNPQTGRSHQLRFELANQGYPIVGDTLYGSTVPFKDGGIALRAVSLDFSQCNFGPFGLPSQLKVKGL